VLPMTDAPVRTRVRARGAWHPFQQFMIRERGQGPVEDVAFDGADVAAPSREVLDAIAAADAIVVGPSNPGISNGPIHAGPGLRDAIAASSAPVIGVSPLVRGKVLKGPTDAFLQWAAQPLSADGIVAHYGGLLDALVSDERASDIPTLETDVELGTPAARQRVAEATLGFASALAG
jgi:LPPG:FO 2-phospho-L-lactate transferase